MVKRLAWFVPLLAVAALLPSAPRQSAAAATCHPALKKLSVSPASVPGGASSRATVTLTCATPKAMSVQLKGFKGAIVPSSLRVAARKSSATGTIRTAQTTAIRRGKIVATLGRVHRAASLTVTRTPRSCQTPVITGISVPRLVTVGSKPTASLRLSCAPRAPIRISVTSSNADLRVPASITVLRFYDTATIPLTLGADPAGQYKATITARFHGSSRHGSVTANPGMSLFKLLPSTEPNMPEPEVLFTGTVPAGGLTVKFASSSPALTVPASFTFAAGSVGGGITGVVIQGVTKNTKVIVTASFGGRTLTATTVLIPPFNSSDSVMLFNENAPGPIYGQDFNLEYEVLLSNPAPDGGLTVTFSAGDPSIELQETSADITAGFVEGFTNISVASVTAPVHTEIDATVDGVTASLPVTIEPGLTAVDAPATITGGDSFTGTVSLAGPVDTDTTVELQTGQGVLSVPVTVVIPKGQSSVTFQATSVPVDSSTDVFIEATLGTTQVFSTVTLTPPA
ncbi:MAG TPA: hypothetical protein VGI64_13945 [Streptosporangiaceae bacterium]|jgi:hypothetical protein